MDQKIEALASLIRAKKDSLGKKCVVMLGAGASLSSGIKPTNEIMEELLHKHGPDLKDGGLRERFDQLWSRSDADTRDMFLKKYLELEPKSGYRNLARLISEGYIDLVITFNFDRLLEKALGEFLAPDEVQVVVRGEFRSDADVRRSMSLARPRVKILKMHGGLKGGDTFLFSREEMHKYGDEIEDLLRDLTRREIIVCGYAFQDACVERSFARDGGHVYWVNPGGAPPGLGAILRNRNSDGWIFEKASGYFDTFATQLYQALKENGGNGERPRANPFKFLLSYSERDAGWFYGRTRLTQELRARFEESPPRALHLVGPAKAGKTSFARAGLLGNLDPQRFRGVYLRCQSDLESWLPEALGNLPPGRENLTAAVQKLVESTGKHVVVVLDQFERVASRYPERRQLVHCLAGLCECACEKLTFVCVGVDDVKYLKALSDARVEWIDIPALNEKIVGGIVGRMARRAEIRFEPAVIQAIMQRYRESMDSERPFTLAHVQAVCNILADSKHVDLASYERAVENNSEALDMALNVCDFVSYVEDIPDETSRSLFRKVMKVIPVESKKILAKRLKENFADLFTPPEYDEMTHNGKAAGHGAG